MKLGRLNNGEKIAAVSAILLYAFMSFDWFGNKDSAELQAFSVGRNAWEALDVISIVLLVTVIAAIAVAMLRLLGALHEPRVPVNVMVAVSGFASTLLIFFRIINPPNFGYIREMWGKFAIEGTVQFPVFLALLAAAGIAAGGCLAIWEEGLSTLRARQGKTHI